MNLVTGGVQQLSVKKEGRNIRDTRSGNPKKAAKSNKVNQTQGAGKRGVEDYASSRKTGSAKLCGGGTIVGV